MSTVRAARPPARALPGGIYGISPKARLGLGPLGFRPESSSAAVCRGLANGVEPRPRWEWNSNAKERTALALASRI